MQQINKEVIEVDDKKLDLTNNSSVYSNILQLNVENLGELENLIRDVKEKEKALHEAVHRLETFKLKISFINK